MNKIKKLVGKNTILFIGRKSYITGYETDLSIANQGDEYVLVESLTNIFKDYPQLISSINKKLKEIK